MVLQQNCTRRLMVLKEVAILRLCIYVCPLHEKSLLFTIVRKVQHCIGYPLIQVEIVSVKVTMCAGWLPKVLC